MDSKTFNSFYHIGQGLDSFELSLPVIATVRHIWVFSTGVLLVSQKSFKVCHDLLAWPKKIARRNLKCVLVCKMITQNLTVRISIVVSMVLYRLSIK